MWGGPADLLVNVWRPRSRHESSVAVCSVLGMAGTISLRKEAEEKKKPDPEQVFKKSDKNSDGFLTVEEFLGKRAEDPEKEGQGEKAFAAKDKDKDMKLSLEEFKAMPEKKKP